MPQQHLIQDQTEQGQRLPTKARGGLGNVLKLFGQFRTLELRSAVCHIRQPLHGGARIVCGKVRLKSRKIAALSMLDNPAREHLRKALVRLVQQTVA
jgi:hypothetical protein